MAFIIATETFFIIDHENILASRVIPHCYLEDLITKHNKRFQVVQIIKEFGMIGNFSKN